MIPLLALLACGNEYHFYNTGDDPFYRVGTYELPQTESHRFDLDDDGYYDTCSTTSSYVHIFDFTGTTINYAVMYSNAWEVDPPSSWEPVDLWTLYVGPAGYWAVYPGDQYTSGQVYAEPWSSDPNDGWYAEFSEEDLDDFNFCYPNCSFYTFGTEIHDGLTAQSNSCVFYDEADDSVAGDTALDVYVYYNNETEEGDTPSKARCVPGTATFQLVPYRYQDANDDGFVTSFFKAMQETVPRRGTAPVLTGDATVTKVKPLSTNGTTLRAMSQDKSFSFDDDDKLVTTRGAYTNLTEGRTTRFTRSQLSGGVPFVSEDNIEGDEPMEVEMTWTCPLAGTDSAADDGFEQGYTFALEDVGCPFAPKQKITARPVLGAEPYVQLELYGMTTNNLKVPLTYNGGRWYFTTDLYGSDVVGSLMPDGESLDVTFDTIRYWDTDYCTTGDYVFAKEG